MNRVDTYREIIKRIVCEVADYAPPDLETFLRPILPSVSAGWHDLCNRYFYLLILPFTVDPSAPQSKP
jgi:hypothetical protein